MIRETKVFWQYAGRYTRKQLSQSELPTCSCLRGFNTNRESPVPIQHFFPSLAQLVEQWTLNPWVVGSSPTGRTKKREKALNKGLFAYCLTGKYLEYPYEMMRFNVF